MPYLTPVRRPLKIFAYDPMLGRLPLHRITLDVLNEPLKPGPCGSRVHVLDYDGVADCFYEPVDLDDAAVLMQGGLDPTEFDPRFHQQMVYAVAMKVIENFEIALGRRFQFRGRRPLRIFPHAFRGANAFYDPRRHALLFGYFPASEQRAGSNAPGQTVYACLSHDIIAHEMTHAVTHRLRRHFFNPSNVDVLAFHEGFADVVAIFQHFSFPAILREEIQRSQGDLRANTSLVKLAAQFGQATGNAEALRTAVDEPDPAKIRTAFEPHERGSILVAAVFDAFFRTYQDRIQDLIRIATGGTGRLPQGDLHPDLVNRIAREATGAASATLRMCIRAFNYLPPVDITFGDYLRAMVTADFELNPVDEGGLRRQMIEAFRVRGIYPSGVASLSEESLRWERYDEGAPDSRRLLTEELAAVNAELVMDAAETSRNSAHDDPLGPPPDDEEDDAPNAPNSRSSDRYGALRSWAMANRDLLRLSGEEGVKVDGMHSSFRVAQDGQLLMETILQFTQERETDRDLGGVKFRGGTTVVVKANGAIQYVISKPLPHAGLPPQWNDAAEARLGAQADYVAMLDDVDPFSMWQDEAFQKTRVSSRMTLAALHRCGM